MEGNGGGNEVLCFVDTTRFPTTATITTPAAPSTPAKEHFNPFPKNPSAFVCQVCKYNAGLIENLEAHYSTVPHQNTVRERYCNTVSLPKCMQQIKIRELVFNCPFLDRLAISHATAIQKKTSLNKMLYQDLKKGQIALYPPCSKNMKPRWGPPSKRI